MRETSMKMAGILLSVLVLVLSCGPDDTGDECVPVLEICGDGIDNDCDGNKDCWDSDCGFEGPSERSCDDDKDNDCDGNTDCSDSDCDRDSACVSEEICDNGVDDDGDGNKDCWDSDCGFEGPSERSCDDDKDNDCDGNTDCSDSDCDDDPICDSGVCGNGVIEGDEDCDGTTLGGQTCRGLGYEGGMLLCASCEFDTSNCDDCGNGVIDPGEDCDGFELGGYNCRALGFLGGGMLLCTSSCQFDTSNCDDELGGIGDPCEDNGDCEDGLRCIEEWPDGYWPDGYCTQDCSCPSGTTCFSGMCFLECARDSDCRDDYICNPSDVCVPSCFSDSHCSACCDIPSGICGACDECGDGTCDPDSGETRCSCPSDCGTCSGCCDDDHCWDGDTDAHCGSDGDTCDRCTGDEACNDDNVCEAGGTCGDGICDSDEGEGRCSCPSDCGTCSGCCDEDECWGGGLDAHCGSGGEDCDACTGAERCLDYACQGDCVPWTTEERDCGDCGTQTRTCTGSHTWGSWGSCTGEGVCTPSSSESRACGVCGTQTRTCRSTCSWGSWGTCADGDSDMYEPNNTSGTKYSFGLIGPCFSSFRDIDATILPANDKDWYQFYVEDSGCMYEYLRFTAYLQDLPANYNLGTFYRCPGSVVPEYTCEFGSWFCRITGSDGSDFHGCCSDNTGTAREDIRAEIDCPGTTNDSVYIYLYVWPGTAADVSCDLYTISYVVQ